MRYNKSLFLLLRKTMAIMIRINPRAPIDLKIKELSIYKLLITISRASLSKK